MSDTHGIAQWSSNQLVVDSTGLGWHDAYASLAIESSWKATLPALPHYSLAYFVRSSARVHRCVEGAAPESATMRPRRFGMIPASRSSTWELDGNPEVGLVYIRRETVDELAADEFGVDPSSLHIEPRLGFEDGLLEQLVLSLLDTARHAEHTASSGLWADQVARLIAMRLLRSYSNLAVPAQPTAIDLGERCLETARDYIDANLTADLTLAGIADAVGARPHQLARGFGERFGMTLHQYVIRRRVERAAHLLRTSSDPIAVIAVESGFASQSHLTTAFRRAFATTPAAYRR